MADQKTKPTNEDVLKYLNTETQRLPCDSKYNARGHRDRTGPLGGKYHRIWQLPLQIRQRARSRRLHDRFLAAKTESGIVRPVGL